MLLRQEMFRPDVLCLGSATVDHILIVYVPFSLVKAGAEGLVKSIHTYSGGGATNSAAALSKLGLRVKILTKMGKDHQADIVNKELKEYGIKNVCLKYSKKNTDEATIISSAIDKDRIIYVHKGASDDLGINDFKHSKINSAWIYLATLVGKSFNTAKKITELARKKRIKILFNPSLYLAKKGRIYLKSVLEATSILVLNKDEAQELLKIKASEPKLLLELHKLGPRTAIITNGPKTLYAYDNHIIYSLNPPKVKVVQTAGAGDAFTAGFLAGIIKKYSFADALRLGQANSTSIIQHIGAKGKLLNEHEARSLMNQLNIKVKQDVSRY